MKRYLIIYKGRVQGVGFRWKLINIARRYGLTGYAKNLYNGDVEVEVQGNSGLKEFINDSLSNDRFIEIEDYSIKEIPVDEDERDFDVKYY